MSFFELRILTGKFLGLTWDFHLSHTSDSVTFYDLSNVFSLNIRCNEVLKLQKQLLLSKTDLSIVLSNFFLS